MKELSFVHASDAHLNYFHYNLPERLEDFNHAFEWFCKESKKLSPDFVLFTGDLFDNPHPSNVVLSQAIEAIDSIKSPFLVVPGSHDAAYNVSVGTVLDPLDSGKHLHYLPDKPFENQDIYVYGMHNYRSRDIFKSRGQDDLNRIKPTPKKGKFNVFALHQAVGFSEMDLHKDLIDLIPEELPPGFQYYAAGHVHYPKVIHLPKGGVFVQTGSLEITDYSMADHPTGFFHVKVDTKGNVEPTYINYPDRRRFVVINEDFTGMVASDIEKRANKIISENDDDEIILVLVMNGVLPHGTQRSDIDYFRIRAQAKKALYTNLVNKLHHPKITTREVSGETLDQQAKKFLQEYFKGTFGKNAPEIANLVSDMRDVYGRDTLSRKQRQDTIEKLIEKVLGGLLE